VNDFLRTEFDVGSSDAIKIAVPSLPPCCARVRRGEMTGWCDLIDGHERDHHAVLSVPTVNTYGPLGWSR